MPKVTTVFGKRLLVVANLCLPLSLRSKFIGSLHFRSEFNTSTVPCYVRLASQNPTRPPTEVGDYKDKAC
jgi:hypothetical protein